MPTEVRSGWPSVPCSNTGGVLSCKAPILSLEPTQTILHWFLGEERPSWGTDRPRNRAGHSHLVLRLGIHGVITTLLHPFKTWTETAIPLHYIFDIKYTCAMLAAVCVTRNCYYYCSEINPTRCNNCVFLFSAMALLYMFRVTISPIIRSTYAVYGHR